MVKFIKNISIKNILIDMMYWLVLANLAAILLLAGLSMFVRIVPAFNIIMARDLQILSDISTVDALLVCLIPCAVIDMIVGILILWVIKVVLDHVWKFVKNRLKPVYNK